MNRGSGFLAVAVLALLGAVAVVPTAQAKGPLYVVGGNSNAVGVHAVAADGALGPVSPVATVQTPRSAVITPAGGSLYTTGHNGDNIGTHSVDPSTGALGPVGTPVPAGLDPIGPAITPNGQFLYVANENGNSISGYSIDPGTGGLTSLGPAVLLANPNGLAITPDGTKLYATTDTGVQPYSIGGNGAITAIGGLVTTGAANNPRAIAITPNGQFLYVANSNAPNTIGGFSIGGDGTLTSLGAAAPTGNTPFGLAITQDGRFIYTANFTAAADPAKVNAFAIGGNGALSPVPGQPFNTGSEFPYAVDAAPNGRVYVANDVQGGPPGTVTAFNVGGDGALTTIGSPTTTVIAPEFQSIVMLPNLGPTAAFTAATSQATRGGGSTLSFNATGSSDPQGGSVARFDWDFGDGTTLPDGGPTPSHVYAQPGNYTVTLTVTDDEGCSTQVIFTGQTADCNGSGAARSQQTIQVAGGGGPPTLKLSGKKKQPLAKTVKVKAVTQEDTEAVARGTLAIQGPKKGKRVLRGVKLKKVTADLEAGVKRTLKPKLSKKAFKKADRALDKGGKVKAKVTVKATDADADADKAKRTIKLK